MFCKKCGFELNENDKFCSKCGTSVLNKCPQCKEPYSVQQQFCVKCGFELNNPKIDEQKSDWNVLLRDFFNQYYNWHVNNIIFPQHLLEEPSNIKYEETVRNQFMIAENQTIYMVYDTSSFNSAKEGIVVTNSGVYCNSGTILKKFSWNEFSKIKIYSEKRHLYVDKFPFWNFKEETKKSYDVITSLQTYVKQLLI